ncbi:MAG: hypothetical protein JRI87_12610 [Deltaproteobacteria bacterium]|nr:hypothetical protein [Deltaproteobacteria bacterium]
MQHPTIFSSGAQKSRAAEGYIGCKKIKILSRICQKDLFRRYCDISGKSWDENGHFVGDTCPVCKGKGVNNIGSNASQTDEHYFWDLIHPKIVEISKSRFDAGHYADAVESAMKENYRPILKKTSKKVIFKYFQAL